MGSQDSAQKSGETFSGIDPDKLPGTISSLDNDQKALLSSATRFSARFSHFGIDTQPLSRLIGIAHWANGQLPMLRRRQHLAVAADEYTQNSTMIFIADSAIVPGGAAKATADGKALAQRFAQQMSDHHGAVPEDLFTTLGANAKDGDFLKGFYDEIGPQRFSQLSNSMADNPYDDRYQDHPDQRAYDRDVLCRTFGAYTRTAVDSGTPQQKREFWSAWFDRFDDPGQGFRPDLLLPLVDSGTYDKDFLVALGGRVFTADRSRSVTARMAGSGDDPWEADHYVQFFDALAKNPQAAGEFMSAHPDVIDNGLYPGGGNTTSARTTAFVSALKAATVDLRSTDKALADRNTAWLLADNLAHTQDEALQGTHPYPEVSRLYSEIMALHWDDLQYAITSPAQDGFWDAASWDPKAYQKAQNPARDGLEIQPAAWKAFMEESIREPHAAASMSALFEANRRKLADQVQLSTVSKDDQDAMRFLGFERGLMDSFYGESFTTTEQQMGDEAQAWADEMTSARETLIGVAASLATGEPGAAAGMAKEKGQEIAMGLLQDWIHQNVKVAPVQAPKDLVDGIKGLKDAELSTSWRTTFLDYSAALVSDDETLHSIDPVTLALPGKPSQVYTGDPYGRGKGQIKYVTGPADDFVTVLRKYGGGNAMAHLTPRQLDAYSRWVQDPAVVARNAGRGAYDTLIGRQVTP